MGLVQAGKPVPRVVYVVVGGGDEGLREGLERRDQLAVGADIFAPLDGQPAFGQLGQATGEGVLVDRRASGVGALVEPEDHAVGPEALLFSRQMRGRK